MNFLLNLYQSTLELASPALEALLRRRLARGKEDAGRLGERMGQAGLPRPSGKLIWLHGASVGEAQSTLILIDALRARFPAVTILITTGTVASARYLQQRLPAGVIHQYYPVDRPSWVQRFLNHWQPDFVVWMESEIWPAMLCALRARQIPALLLNARLSPRSLKRWQRIPQTARALLQGFTAILAQTERDAHAYRLLGAQNVSVSGNLKYAADPLPVDPVELERLQQAAGLRPCWVYASTHAGEEALACRLHQSLSASIPDLLTIIVPRHPVRAAEIISNCQDIGPTLQLRGEAKIAPARDTGVYIADTLGELGLFYRFAPIACMGRSFSNDGGGGHNPIEAAQLDCAVLYGPHVQNLQAIYDEMAAAGAALQVLDEKDFQDILKVLLLDRLQCEKLSRAAQQFIKLQSDTLQRILNQIIPLAESALARNTAKGTSP